MIPKTTLLLVSLALCICGAPPSLRAQERPALPQTTLLIRWTPHGIPDAQAGSAEISTAVQHREAPIGKTVPLGKGLPPLLIKRYLPRAELSQQVLPAPEGSPAVLLSISGPRQAYERWLKADDARRNRLQSLIANWRYMSIAAQEREPLFKQYQEERKRKPKLVIRSRSGGPVERLPVEVGKEVDVPGLDCKVLVLELYPHFSLDQDRKPMNLSPRNVNPAAHVRITSQGKTEERWVLARKMQRRDKDELPFEISLDAPIERTRRLMDFVIVTIDGERQEIWSRQGEICHARAVSLKEKVPIEGTRYAFSLERFEPSGKLVEVYVPTKRPIGSVSVLEVAIETPDGKKQSAWLRSGRPTVIPYGSGRLSISFKEKRAATPTSRPSGDGR